MMYRRGFARSEARREQWFTRYFTKALQLLPSSTLCRHRRCRALPTLPHPSAPAAERAISHASAAPKGGGTALPTAE